MFIEKLLSIFLMLNIIYFIPLFAFSSSFFPNLNENLEE